MVMELKLKQVMGNGVWCGWESLTNIKGLGKGEKAIKKIIKSYK